MDFRQLEAIEALRWSWNSWPTTKSDDVSRIISLSLLGTLLMQSSDISVLPYDPFNCSKCVAVLNPYANVDSSSPTGIALSCYAKNPFPCSYALTVETNLSAELFPTYSSVEYASTAHLTNHLSSAMSLLSVTSFLSRRVQCGWGLGGFVVVCHRVVTRKCMWARAKCRVGEDMGVVA